MVSEQFSFYGVRLITSRPTPKRRTRVSLFVWLLPLDLSCRGDSVSSYATAGIALRVSGALKPLHHDKVETLLVGIRRAYCFKIRKVGYKKKNVCHPQNFSLGGDSAVGLSRRTFSTGERLMRSLKQASGF
jgi:hypothetical protein